MSTAEYLERLRALPFVREVAIGTHANLLLDGVVEIQTEWGLRIVPFVHVAEQLDLELARAWAVRAESAPGLLLFTPYAPNETVLFISRTKANVMDLLGNCSIRLGDDFCAMLYGSMAARLRDSDDLPSTPSWG